MSEYTIAEVYELPSKGLIYDPPINPNVKLRSMTTEEEMRRLNHTDTPYKVTCDVIDRCIVDPIGISAYDLHLGDEQFLLHKLRIVTYGSAYKTASICPICGMTNNRVMNLDELPVRDFDLEEFKKISTFELPISKREIHLRFQTPRIVEQITKDKNDFNKANPESDLNMEYLLNLVYSIDTVDGKKVNTESLKIWLRQLPASDSNCIFQHMAKLTEEVGINTLITNKCDNPKCGAEYPTTFRATSEFFGPSIDF